MHACMPIDLAGKLIKPQTHKHKSCRIFLYKKYGKNVIFLRIQSSGGGGALRICALLRELLKKNLRYFPTSIRMGFVSADIFPNRALSKLFFLNEFI